MNFQLVETNGPQAAEHIDALSNLRIRVFRDFPYLYDGNLDYEKRYLKTYFSCAESFVALCYDGNKIVGASTAIPMQNEEKSFREPLERAGWETKKICYFGESILLPEYRGKGIGKLFFEAREKYARKMNLSRASFCAVIREENHPMRPKNYRSLEDFWRNQGYKIAKGITTTYSWKDLGQVKESAKPMQFWVKNLEEKNEN